MCTQLLSTKRCLPKSPEATRCLAALQEDVSVLKEVSLFGCLVGWLVGWLVGRLFGWLVGSLVGFVGVVGFASVVLCAGVCCFVSFAACVFPECPTRATILGKAKSGCNLTAEHVAVDSPNWWVSAWCPLNFAKKKAPSQHRPMWQESAEGIHQRRQFERTKRERVSNWQLYSHNDLSGATKRRSLPGLNLSIAQEVVSLAAPPPPKKKKPPPTERGTHTHCNHHPHYDCHCHRQRRRSPPPPPSHPPPSPPPPSFPHYHDNNIDN